MHCERDKVGELIAICMESLHLNSNNEKKEERVRLIREKVGFNWLTIEKHHQPTLNRQTMNAPFYLRKGAETPEFSKTFEMAEILKCL